MLLINLDGTINFADYLVIIKMSIKHSTLISRLHQTGGNFVFNWVFTQLLSADDTVSAIFICKIKRYTY